MEVYDNADELLKRTDIDGVIISANNNQHRSLVIKAARAGKHIICEKPAAISVAEFDEMMAETERAEVTFTVHQQRRYDKDFQSVKACYDKRLVGISIPLRVPCMDTTEICMTGMCIKMREVECSMIGACI